MGAQIKVDKEKIKQEILNQGYDNIDDAELLKSVIALAFSSSEADKITKSLFDKYDNLSNILKADAHSLLKVEGINEQMAVFISMLHPIRQRVMTEQNAKITNLSSISMRKKYGANLLRGKKLEAIAIVNLDKYMDIIGSHIISEGTANFSQVNPVELIKAVMYDQPEYIIIMHNHPDGNSSPSLQDFSFTVSTKETLNSVGFKLIDHIIIGSETEYSMSESAKSYLTD